MIRQTNFLHFFLSTSLFIVPFTLSAQSDTELKTRKKLIDEIEVFAGPNLSFNYGNMFIEKYHGKYTNDNYVQNKRHLKPGYLVGAGVYHHLGRRVDLNVRVQFETRGTRSELNNPLNPANDDSRQITEDEYTFRYMTVTISPTIHIGREKKWSVSIGAYYSKVLNVRGTSKSYNTRDNHSNSGSFNGRYFYRLRDDGGIEGVSWMPYLTGIEENDLGLVAALSYTVPLGKQAMLFQLQDSFGLVNINKNNPYNLKEMSHALTFIVSYNFNLSSKQ